VRLKPVDRPPLRPVTTLTVAISAFGPQQVSIDYAALASAVTGQATDVPFVVTSVVNGRVQIETAGEIRDLSNPPDSASPSNLLTFLAERVVRPNDRLYWSPVVEGGKLEAFRLVGIAGRAAGESLVKFDITEYFPNLGISLTSIHTNGY
jgi:hypothetical protein